MPVTIDDITLLGAGPQSALQTNASPHGVGIDSALRCGPDEQHHHRPCGKSFDIATRLDAIGKELQPIVDDLAALPDHAHDHHDLNHMLLSLRRLVCSLHSSVPTGDVSHPRALANHYDAGNIETEHSESDLHQVATAPILHDSRKCNPLDVELLSKEMQRLELRNSDLESMVSCYRDCTHAEQKLVQQHKNELKTQMAFVKEYEGAIIDQRRTLAAAQRILRTREQRVSDGEAEVEKQSADMMARELRLEEKQKSLNALAFRLYLKQETLDAKAVGLGPKEDGQRVREGTITLGDHNLESKLASSRNRTTSPFKSAIVQDTSVTNTKGGSVRCQAMGNNSVLPPHLRAIADNPCVHVPLPACIQETIAKTGTAYLSTGAVETKSQCAGASRSKDLP